jgi:single-strand DNA-binding protein
MSNNVVLAIAIEAGPELRYTSDSQKPVQNAIARFTDYETEHVIKLTRWSDAPLTAGVISGRLHIVSKKESDRPYYEIIVEECWPVEGEIGPVNVVNLAGRVGGDPEVKYFESGKVVAKFTMAVNRNGKDVPPDWVNVEAWGKTAETVGNYLRKGALIGVHGSLKTESWQDKEGNPQSKLVVKADQFRFLGSKKDSEQYQGQAEQRQPAMAAATPTARPSDIDYEDIPF